MGIPKNEDFYTGGFYVLCKNGGLYKVLRNCYDIILITYDYTDETDQSAYNISGTKAVLWGDHNAAVISNDCNLVDVNLESSISTLRVKNSLCAAADNFDANPIPFVNTKIKSVAHMVASKSKTEIYTHSGDGSHPLRSFNSENLTTSQVDAYTNDQFVYALGLNRVNDEFEMVTETGIHTFKGPTSIDTTKILNFNIDSSIIDGPVDSATFKDVPTIIDSTLGKVTILADEKGSVRVWDKERMTISSLCEQTGLTSSITMLSGNVSECKLAEQLVDILVDPSYSTIWFLFKSAILTMGLKVKYQGEVT